MLIATNPDRPRRVNVRVAVMTALTTVALGVVPLILLAYQVADWFRYR